MGLDYRCVGCSSFYSSNASRIHFAKNHSLLPLPNVRFPPLPANPTPAHTSALRVMQAGSNRVVRKYKDQKIAQRDIAPIRRFRRLGMSVSIAAPATTAPAASRGTVTSGVSGSAGASRGSRGGTGGGEKGGDESEPMEVD
ncbi:hypothetical protein BDC45DRAFT_576067 [Circinella umbellata]|nr:hypothetical protein BDC45DRAFT_576067 [Circinella umbellata]